jgi:hypothetical protein
MQIVVSFRDHVLANYANRLEALAAGSGRAVLAQALEAGGTALRKATVTAETAQTGLSHDTIDRAQHEIAATPATLAYTIVSKGGNVRLKYFGAKEGGGGVTAHPWNAQHFYAGAFITSGRPGNRRPSPKLGGHVYKNIAGGKWGGSIRQERSGLFIPVEMTSGRTAATFNKASATLLATTVISRLGALLP